MKTNLTVKVTPQDATWETSQKLYKTIHDDVEIDGKVDGDLNIIIDGIYTDRKSSVGAGNINNYGGEVKSIGTIYNNY